MFSIDPSRLWPWIRFEPPSDVPPGFRLTADGSINAATSHDAGSGSRSPAGPLLYPSLWSDPQHLSGEFPLQSHAPAPGFHVVAPLAGSPATDPPFASSGYGPPADLPWPAGSGTHPIGDGGNPFSLLDRRHPIADPIPALDAGSFPPIATSLLFPRMADWQLPSPGPQSDDDDLYAAPDRPRPDHGIEPGHDWPNFPVANGSVPDSSPDEAGPASSVYDPHVYGALPVESAAGERTGAAKDIAQTEVSSVHERLREALEQIADIYSGIESGWINRANEQGANRHSTIRGPDGSFDGALAALGDALDPRHVVQTGGPTGQPPGPGRNVGPPLRQGSSVPARNQPQRSGSIQGRPSPAPQPPDNSTAGAGAEAAIDHVVSELLAEPVPSSPEAGKKLETWQKIVSARGEQAPSGQYLGHDGLETLVGARLNPRLREPAAGRHYLPAHRHLRDGYRGELQLANRIVAALPDEIVIHYGMPAGRQGPDVISVSRDGTISVWDSKWRTGLRSIGPSQGAHQGGKSLRALYFEIRRHISDAIESGHLTPDVGAAAMKNASAQNFDIYTIGTGNAHNGVVQYVRDGTPSNPRRPE